jgi:hypothetical protein
LCPGRSETELARDALVALVAEPTHKPGDRLVAFFRRRRPLGERNDRPRRKLRAVAEPLQDLGDLGRKRRRTVSHVGGSDRTPGGDRRDSRGELVEVPEGSGEKQNLPVGIRAEALLVRDPKIC